jgi:hypothetical protein
MNQVKKREWERDGWVHVGPHRWEKSLKEPDPTALNLGGEPAAKDEPEEKED